MENMPSEEELLQWLESVAGISDEDKESIRMSILNPGQAYPEPEPYEDPGININAEQALLKLAVLIILGTLVFFGYKLYRSLMDKQRKREDKKRLKINKKKK